MSNAPPRGPVLALLLAMRPKQWTKNLLLFAGLLFTLDRHPKLAAFEQASLAFLLFSLLSGATYLINDVLDVESDREHPTKCQRPIAAGHLSPQAAVACAAVIVAACLFASFHLGERFGLAALAYVVLTLVYSFKVKHVVILDLLFLALGFVLRAVAGAWAIHVLISEWLVLCTFLLALFLGISKRRGELVAVKAGRRSHRPILTEYSADMLDQMSAIVTSALLMSYALYAITTKAALSRHMVVTIPFVLYGIFRYLYLIHRHNQGESPDEILTRDKPLLIDIFLWAATAAILIVHPHWP